MRRTLLRLDALTHAAEAAYRARDKGARPQSIILDGPLGLQWLAYTTSSEKMYHAGLAQVGPKRQFVRYLQFILAACFKSSLWMAVGIGQFVYGYDGAEVDAMLTMLLSREEWGRDPSAIVKRVTKAWPLWLLVGSGRPESVEALRRARSASRRVDAWEPGALNGGLARAFAVDAFAWVTPAWNRANRRSVLLADLSDRFGLVPVQRGRDEEYFPPCDQDGGAVPVDEVLASLKAHAPLSSGLAAEFIRDPYDMIAARRNRMLVHPDEFAQFIASHWLPMPPPLSRLRIPCFR
jgi:hypothetical protein